MPRYRHRQLAASRLLSPAVVPEISCIVSAKTPLGFSLSKFVAAAQRFVDEYLGPVWDVAAHLRIRRTTRSGCWALAFVDTERKASDDGWHDLTDHEAANGSVRQRRLPAMFRVQILPLQRSPGRKT